MHHRWVDRQICDTSSCVGNSLSLIAFLKFAQKIALGHRFGLSSSLISAKSILTSIALMLGGASCFHRSWQKVFSACDRKNTECATYEFKDSCSYGDPDDDSTCASWMETDDETILSS